MKTLNSFFDKGVTGNKEDSTRNKTLRGLIFFADNLFQCLVPSWPTLFPGSLLFTSCTLGHEEKRPWERVYILATSFLVVLFTYRYKLLSGFTTSPFSCYIWDGCLKGHTESSTFNLIFCCFCPV